MTDVASVLARLEAAAVTLDPVEVPGVVIRLAGVLAVLGARVPAPTNGAGSLVGLDRLLTTQEVHERTTLSVAYLYRHADALPFFARRVGRKVLFSEARLTKWLAQRAS